MRKEPAIIVAALAAIIQGVLIYVTSDPTYDASEILTPVLTLIVGALVRQKVMPVATVKEAGLHPSDIKERAADPRIPSVL